MFCIDAHTTKLGSKALSKFAERYDLFRHKEKYFGELQLMYMKHILDVFPENLKIKHEK